MGLMAITTCTVAIILLKVKGAASVDSEVVDGIRCWSDKPYCSFVSLAIGYLVCLLCSQSIFKLVFKVGIKTNKITISDRFFSVKKN